MLKRSLLIAACAALWLPAQLLHASPYASSITITNNGAGVTNVQFFLNESGGNVTVTYEDGSTNATYNGLTTGLSLAHGQYSFSLSGHSGYAISVTKTANGFPAQTSTDTAGNANTSANYTYWNSGRGVAINSNPKIGSLFGRVYVDNSAASTSGNPTKGLYCLNPDLSFAGISNTAVGISTGIFGVSGSASAPYHIRVAPDGTLYVGDFSTADAAMWQFSSDLQSSNLILGPVGETAAVNAHAHGDMFGTSHISGSLATSNLVITVADGGLPVPTAVQDNHLTLGPGTSAGMYNNVYQYDIGAGPLPWTNGPDYAFNLGLDVIGELTDESDVAPDGKIYAAFGRSNLSNPCLTVLDPTGATVLWNSWVDTGGNGDPWRGDVLGSTVEYPYGGVRVSSDDKFVATMGVDNAFLIAYLTNGIPDDSTLYAITNASNVGNARGMDWDVADNIYGISSGQAELRCYSLGLTATCVTSNDITGTNGTFVIITPPVTATATTTTPVASQNHGSPTPGVINIALSTNYLTAPVTVGFTPSGSATYPLNYTLNLGTTNGIVVTSTNVTFPAGTSPSGNWSVNLLLTPTLTPASGPALTVTYTVLGGAAYTAGGSSAKASVEIVNTGPQLLILSVLPSGSTFSRGVTNDYVTFEITRWGDTSVAAYTVTNINYSGTANYPADYTALAQPWVSGNLLANGSSPIQITPGEVLITNAVGNPVMRANVNVPGTNVTIVLSLTNAVTGTNVTSLEGYSYVVATNSITLTELDYTYGAPVTLWSDPLNSTNDSVNWALTYASEGLGTNTRPCVYVPNYTNNETSYLNGGTNDFDVEFGYGLPSGIPASPGMLANGWTNVLKMTVNKSGAGLPAAVNLYPQGQKFYGNYALRFAMYLSAQNNAIDNPYAGASAREYALFGYNHTGTNCNWRPSLGAPVGYSGTTNSDGEWFAINEGDDAATPADFDCFTPPGLPNSGITADFVSNPGSAERGIFKNPPFVNTENPAGGEPVDQWVNVSLETTQQTNSTLYINGAAVLQSISIGATNSTTINSVPSQSGTVMLGYLDPDKSIGDPSSQFVLYSDVRVVELSPYITNQPLSYIVTNGATVTLAASATYATAPLTNTWYKATTPTNAVTALQTNSTAGTNLTDTLVLSSVQVGTNYLNVFSDAAGSVTGTVAQVEVIAGPTNQTVYAGSNYVQFAVIPSGPSAPTSYQWKTNGVNIVNNSHYSGATNATLTITNVELVDAVTYTCAVTNSAGGVTPSATLTVNASSPTFSGISIVGPSVYLSFTSIDPYDTTNSYTVLRSTNVQGPYSVATATNVGSAGTFQFKLPVTSSGTMFYRLLHN